MLLNECMNNFWNTLPKPFFVLAPMANVTDAAFRRMIAKYGKPDVMYTEFVSADGLFARQNIDEDGQPRADHPLMRDLLFTEGERPIVAQFFTSNPANMEKAAALAARLGFDGIDINMGCPDKTIEKQQAGAKLILDPELAAELIAAAKRGAGGLPVSVKTRLGYNKDVLEEWLPALLAAEPAAIILHARTRKEMSKVPARWERIARAALIRNEMKSKTLIIGNGDALDPADARAKAAMSNADGVMLGRAIFGTPWLFNEGADPDLAERLRIMVEHTKLFEELLGDIKSFAIMKKHFKAYCENFPGAKELRMQLMETHNAAEVEALVKSFIASTIIH